MFRARDGQRNRLIASNDKKDGQAETIPTEADEAVAIIDDGEGVLAPPEPEEGFFRKPKTIRRPNAPTKQDGF